MWSSWMANRPEMFVADQVNPCCCRFFGLKEKHMYDIYGYLWIHDISWYYIRIYDICLILIKRKHQKKDTMKNITVINWWSLQNTRKEAESLQLMHQHLVDAGGANLDFEPMDRNWAGPTKKPSKSCHGRIGSPKKNNAYPREFQRWWMWVIFLGVEISDKLLFNKLKYVTCQYQKYLLRGKLKWHIASLLWNDEMMTWHSSTLGCVPLRRKVTKKWIKFRIWKPWVKPIGFTSFDWRRSVFVDWYGS